jgi:hypothetical protein
MHGVRAFALSVSLLAVSGCAATTYAHRTGDNRVGDAVGEPFRDAGWTRENPPEVLIRAAAAPYALPIDTECSAMLNEIAALDLVLGPDLDDPLARAEESDLDASGLLSGAIGGVLGLPYRSILRRLSGASGRERVLRDAIFAGMVRRAFLKGLARAACAPVTVDAVAATPSPEAPPPDVPSAPPERP